METFLFAVKLALASTIIVLTLPFVGVAAVLDKMIEQSGKLCDFIIG